MSPAEQHKRERDRQAAKLVRSIENLFIRDDSESPSALDDDDREALRVALRIAAESDAAFQELRGHRGPYTRTTEIEYLCDTIRSGIDFYASLKQTACIISGVGQPDIATTNLRAMFVEHGRLFLELQSKDLSLPERVSVLLALIRIELTFFGQFW